MKMKDVELNLFHKVKIRMFFEMCFVICFMLLFAGVGVASTTTVYVATNGTGDYNCDGVDDQVEINQATEYINSIGGGTVHIKSGTYSISEGDAINIYDNTTFEGNSESSILRIIDNASWSQFQRMIKIVGNNVVIQNLVFDGNSFNQTLPSGHDYLNLLTPYTYLSSNITIQNCVLKNCLNDGIEAFGTQYLYVKNNYFEGIMHDAVSGSYSHSIIEKNIVVNNGNAAFRKYYGHDNTFRNNTVKKDSPNPYASSAAMGFEMHAYNNNDCNGDIFEGNVISEVFTYGFFFDAALSSNDLNTLKDVVIKNNIIDTAKGTGGIYGHGIYIKGLWNNMTIENNVIYDVRIGILEDNTEPSGGDISIKNNIIAENREYGIDSNTSNFILSYNDIYGNTLGDYNGTAAGTGDISVNPNFADPENGDFHLKSQYGRWDGSTWIYDPEKSPCIDAGDPNSTYSNEPAPNGGRINMGAYGNTIYASKSVEDTNDTISPTVSIVVPRDGARVFGRVLIEINASDNYGVIKVELYINDVLNYTFYTSPYEWIWDTKEIPEGEYRIKAVAYDTNSNSSEEEITVKVIKVEGIVTHPNPYVKGKSLIEKISFGNLPKEATIRVYTPLGELIETIVHKDTTDGGSKEWDISGIASGVYIYYIESSEGTKKGKVSIVK